MFKLSEKSFKRYLLSSDGIIYLENIVAKILCLNYEVVHNNLVICDNIHFIKKERPHCIIVFFRKNIFVIFKNNNYFSKSKINNDKIISHLSKQYNDYFIYNVNFNDF